MDTLATDSTFAWCAASVVFAGILTASADPISGHCIHAAALALVAVWLIRAAFSDDLRTHWAVFPILAAAAWGLIQLSAHWTVSQFATANLVTTWLARAAFFQVAYASLGNARTKSQILNVLLYGGCAIGIAGIIQRFTSDGQITGTFLNRDHYAVFIELLLPIALTRALLADGPKLVPMAIAGVMYASVIACGARAGALIVTVETLVIAVVALKRNTRARGMVLVLAASMALCTGVAGWQYMWMRLHDSNLFVIRRELLASTLQMIRARPVTGFGLGTWPLVYPAFATFDPPGIFMNHAHNDWAEWMADGGVPFGALLITIAAGSIALLRRSWWALGVPAALVHSLVDFPMQKAALGALAFFILGAAASESRTR